MKVIVWWKFFAPRVGGSLKTLYTSTRFNCSANCNPFRNFHTPRNTRNRYNFLSRVYLFLEITIYGFSFSLLARIS